MIWLRSLSSGFCLGQFGRRIATVAAGTALGQVIILAASPALTRVYSPADWGTLAVYGSVLGLLHSVGGFRYELAIPLPQSAVDGAALTVLAGAAVMALSAVAFLLTAALGDLLVLATDTEAIRGWLWLIPVGVLWAGLNKVLTMWAVRQAGYAVIARTKVAQGGGQVLSQLALGFAGLAPAGLLVGDVIGRASGTTSLLAFATRQGGRHFRRVSLQAVRSVARRYVSFPLVSTPAGFLNITALRLPALLLAAFQGPAVAGWFGLCQAVAAGPIALLGGPVSQVFAGSLAELVREDVRAARALFAKTVGQLALLAGPPALVLVAFGPSLFSLAFGEEWREAGVFSRLLAPMLFAQVIGFPLSLTLTVLERQGVQLAWDAVRVGAVALALWTPAALGWAPRVAIGLFSAVMTLSYAVLLLLSYLSLGEAPAGPPESGGPSHSPDPAARVPEGMP